MEKIVAAFDGLKYSKSTKDYAIELARKANMHLVGLFLDDGLYSSYKIYDVITSDGSSPALLKKLAAKDKAKRVAAAQDFETTCEDGGLEHCIHHDGNIAMQVVKHESIYADLILINKHETLSHYDQKVPTDFIKDLLEDTQCPVLLVPAKYKPIEKIVLLYDGEPSSVFAIKAFCHTLPPLNHLPVEVITVNEAHHTNHVPDDRLIKEFMKRHFPKATYTVLHGPAEQVIVTRLQEIPGNALVVLGAYRRGNLSRFFRSSMADILMEKTSLPLFVAHNR